MTLKSKLSLMTVLLSAVVLTGCGSVKIGRILDNPTRYTNRTVQVEGTVTNAVGALATGAYQVDDGTGKIYVISTSGIPRKGSRVKVDGRVATGISLMGQSFGTTIRERSHKVRY